MSALPLDPTTIKAFGAALAVLGMGIGFLGFGGSLAYASVRAVIRGEPLPFTGLSASIEGKRLTLEAVKTEAGITKKQLKELRDGIADLNARLNALHAALPAGAGQSALLSGAPAGKAAVGKKGRKG